ncbi:MAG: aminoacyl-tRNA hydrolase [Planctomycetota bacterium]|nr:aminoacyl-tRNA hydrolase [Planctomycetota bacterium]
MKLIVGLGNPGKAYDGTRHNVGFDVLSLLASRAGSPVRRQRFQGAVAQVTLRGNSALLLWPLTWMNLSGSSVLAARDFYKIDHENILVICDDFQLPLGTIRLRGSGSGGGQNGLTNVLARLGSTAISRLRIGIGPVAPGWKTADFVLGKFAAHEHADVAGVLERAADAVEEWLALGIEAAMNRFN